MTMRATRLIWQGAGRPDPVEADGTPIKARYDGTNACSMCGEAGARWGYDDAFSTNFWPAENFDQLFPRRQACGVRLCAACVWCARTPVLRASASFSREDGVWFVRRGDLLAHLLNPPEPPFVVCFPRYGADHGGESTGWLMRWPGSPEPEGGFKARGQSKHCAVYAATATSREHYPLQIDDCLRVMVDVSLWRTLAEHAAAVATLLREGGCGATEVREALATLRPPTRAPLPTLARWSALAAPLRPHARSAWWPMLVELLPMPPLTPRPKTGARTASKETAR